MDDCVFCKIIEGEIPREFVYQDEEVVAFKDKNPSAPVHVLVVPRKHIANLNEAQDDDQMLLGKMLLTAKKIAADLGVVEAHYQLVINVGGNMVSHLHLHLLSGKRLTGG
ncbi:MAG: histidine triad nucleotide-binding protein [bacterium]|nr:histidine triad nucleotide-binding protein [bacterium]